MGIEIENPFPKIEVWTIEKIQKLRTNIHYGPRHQYFFNPFQENFHFQQYPKIMLIQNGFEQNPSPNIGNFNTFNGNGQNNIAFNNNINNNFINNTNNNNNIYNNNINNNFINAQIKQPREHLRGLVNIASTCYMNSTIQCFAHVKELFVYFLKPKIQQLISSQEYDQKLFPVFAELIIYLWDSNDTSPIYPNIFKDKLGQINPLFQGAMPNDAKDLLTFLLMQLHEELNNPDNNNRKQNVMVNQEIQQSKKAMLKHFASFFRHNYRSIISELFYGLTYNQTICQYCNVSLYNYQTFNFLIFPLSEVLKHKMQSVNFKSNFNNTVTLEECFQYNQIFTNLTNYYCNNCKRTSVAKYANFLSALPNILIIILNRGVGLQYKVNIDFEENLDLRNYVEYFKESSFYELFGVVTHYGESGASGHFMARCKSPFEECWFLYNDAIVSKIGYFTKEEFFRGNPYILFYKKTKFANQ